MMRRSSVDGVARMGYLYVCLLWQMLSPVGVFGAGQGGEASSGGEFGVLLQ